MWWKWEEVLDALDRQTSFPSTILFDHQTRQSILFEDDNFTNSKRYFWALQSLRLFGEQIEVTLRALPNIFCTLCLLDGNDFSQEEQERVLKSHITEFRAIGERIERKRQEIQGLSDGLFSASSVIEARLAADQNSNIRMLTLVTIAYLPLSFIASIYGMGALPKSANNLASFFIATAVACFITFSIVFNLRNGEKIIFHYLRGRTARLQKKMQKDSDAAWKVRGMQLQEADRNKRIGVPASTWWYLGFLFHRAFGVFTNRRAAEDKQRSGQEV
ncbi:hypothetical protein K440DRAFT_615862 [Wilcoxina mikolae CBS 423.85]|nr:hypothetical protein K440DRAFT_615862 [Wilcoxina mikolae CBS 423.85]